MKRNIAIVLMFTLLFCTLITPASAKDLNEKDNIVSSNIIRILSSNEDISLLSTMPYKGPLKGAKKSGAVKKCHHIRIYQL